uniref:Uncharacterized protein n=1 Tax=Anopheles atroparvus TaxID=41427 RepID=A0A182JK75_ANOAO
MAPRRLSVSIARSISTSTRNHHVGVNVNHLTLRHCEVPPGGGTCCTQMTEHKLALHAKTTLERNTKDNISKLSSVLGARAQRFNVLKVQDLHRSNLRRGQVLGRFGIIFTKMI